MMTDTVDKIISNLARAAIQHIDKEQAAFNYMTDTVDQIASNLVREGINKHRARELAVHFIKLVGRDMSPNPENDDTKSECVVGVDELAILLAEEGLETYRAIDVATHIAGMFGRAEPSGWASVKNVTEYLDDLRGGADE
jgi:hypothetical protein